MKQRRVIPTIENYGPELLDPFFFSDRERTYFVRPADIPIVEWIKFPDRHDLSLEVGPAVEIPPDPITMVSEMPAPESLGLDGPYTGMPFSGDGREGMPARVVNGQVEFHTFHHPFSTAFVTNT